MSDSDDDLFGGRITIATHHDIDNSDSDSDFDDPAPVVKKKKRGRKPKDSSGTSPTTTPRRPKKQDSGVVIIDSDDDEPTTTSPYTPKNNNDIRAEEVLANINRVLKEKSVENIERQAQELARHDLEVEIQKREERERQKQDKEAAEAPHLIPPSNEQGLPIMFNLRMNDDMRTAVRIRQTDPLLRMLAPFCKKFSIDPQTVVMKVDGDVVTASDTPLSLDCDEGMQIDIELKRQ